MDYFHRLPYSQYNENRPYPRRYLDWISATAGAFFAKHPHLLTDETLETMAIGNNAQKFELFGHMEEFYDLNEALESYVRHLQPKPKTVSFLGFLRTMIPWTRPQVVSTKISYKPATVNS